MTNPKKEWARSDNLKRLLSLLKEFGELNFQSMKKKLDVSEPTLTDYIKILEGEDKIEDFKKTGDRRYAWYRIKPQSMKKVEGILLEYDAIKFLEGIDEPFVIHEKGKDGKSSVSIFISNINKENVSPLELKLLEISLRNFAKSWFPILEKTVKVPKPRYKIAFVLTKEK